MGAVQLPHQRLVRQGHLPETVSHHILKHHGVHLLSHPDLHETQQWPPLDTVEPGGDAEVVPPILYPMVPFQLVHQHIVDLHLCLFTDHPQLDTVLLHLDHRLCRGCREVPLPQTSRLGALHAGDRVGEPVRPIGRDHSQDHAREPLSALWCLGVRDLLDFTQVQSERRVQVELPPLLWLCRLVQHGDTMGPVTRLTLDQSGNF